MGNLLQTLNYFIVNAKDMFDDRDNLGLAV
jgi:hypothetical protein